MLKTPETSPIALPILYSFRRCPYAIRARLAIAQAGVAVQLREVLLRDKPQALREVSPKATVPVLVLPDGQVLAESFDIVQWALSGYERGSWRPAESSGLRELVAQNDGEFKRNLDGYKYPDRHLEHSREEYRAAGELWLAELDHRLALSPYLAGDHPGAADIAVLPFVRQFVNTDTEWFATAGYFTLNAWLTAWLASPLFISVMNKYVPWQPSDEPIVFSGHQP
ncbi:MAG: glutathione S-transferase [Gammaproteobacteria bacterium]|nr:glutathione S-transferase [Gammaproteobacteria bacterium]